MKIVTVLKTGKDFDREYVERIAESVPACFEFVCLSDDPSVPGYIPLKYDYPTWWSKMEMFRPNIISDDIFYLDLDSIIVDDLSEELRAFDGFTNIIMLSDFYRPEKLASGVMFVPSKFRRRIWNEWIKRNPTAIMSEYRGDQDFIGELVDGEASVFDEVFPDWICSYKAHIAKTYPKHVTPQEIDPSKSKIVCFHGKPRPRDVDWRLNFERTTNSGQTGTDSFTTQ